MFDCTTDRYDELYAPWLTDAGALLRLAKYKPGEDLLDLCGGTGAVTSAALRTLRPVTDTPLAGDITLLDLNPRFEPNERVSLVTGRAEDLWQTCGEDTYDLVVCRQAIAYLDIIPVVMGIAGVLRAGGRFVFNSFLRPRRFGWKRKVFDGVPYFEAHIFLFSRVFHLQWRRKVKPGWDISIFRYHSPKKLEMLLSPWFHVTPVEKGQSVHWLCTRKAKR